MTTTTNFEYNEPLPPMASLGADPAHSWEPAARRYRDLTDNEKAALPERPTA